MLTTTITLTIKYLVLAVITIITIADIIVMGVVITAIIIMIEFIALAVIIITTIMDIIIIITSILLILLRHLTTTGIFTVTALMVVTITTMEIIRTQANFIHTILTKRLKTP